MAVVHIFPLQQNLPLCHHQQHNLPAYWRTVGFISTFSLACNCLLHRVQWLVPTNQPASPQSVLTISGKVFVGEDKPNSSMSYVHINLHWPLAGAMWHVVCQFRRLLYFIASHIIGNPVFDWGTHAQHCIIIIPGTPGLGPLTHLLLYFTFISCSFCFLHLCIFAPKTKHFLAVLELFIFSAWLISTSSKLASSFCLIPLAVQLTLIPFICLYVFRKATSVSWIATGVQAKLWCDLYADAD